jgi:hypothetical protein
MGPDCEHDLGIVGVGHHQLGRIGVEHLAPALHDDVRLAHPVELVPAEVEQHRHLRARLERLPEHHLVDLEHHRRAPDLGDERRRQAGAEVGTGRARRPEGGRQQVGRGGLAVRAAHDERRAGLTEERDEIGLDDEGDLPADHPTVAPTSQP